MSDEYYGPSRNVVTRSIGGETIMVPIAGGAGDLESIYGVNELGERIWCLLGGKKSIKEVVQAIMDEYEVDPDEAEKDVRDFVRALENFGLVERAVGGGG
jgi:hypothetical protein